MFCLLNIKLKRTDFSQKAEKGMLWGGAWVSLYSESMPPRRLAGRGGSKKLNALPLRALRLRGGVVRAL